MKLKLKPMPDWLGYCIAVPLIFAASPLIAGGFALAGLAWVKRQAIGPRKVWGRWFAWYPVSVDFDDVRWLEVVERQSFGVMCDTRYRPHPAPPENDAELG